MSYLVDGFEVKGHTATSSHVKSLHGDDHTPLNDCDGSGPGCWGSSRNYGAGSSWVDEGPSCGLRVWDDHTTIWEGVFDINDVDVASAVPF